MLDENFNIKIIDFGDARKLDEPENKDNSKNNQNENQGFVN